MSACTENAAQPKVSVADRLVFISRSPRILRALGLLLEASQYAQESNKDLWTYAVGLGEFATAGLSTNDLRWLVSGGYVAHACETTDQADRERTFRPIANLKFTAETCFVLTDVGASLVRSLQSSSPAADVCRSNGSGADGQSVLIAPTASLEPHRRVDGEPGGHASVSIPKWDAIRRELSFAGEIVKRFRLRSPNQETILTAFEEESWPTLIDDPLPQQMDQDPKRRLQDTLKALNRHQINNLLRFKGNGTGEGVLWEMADGLSARRVMVMTP